MMKNLGLSAIALSMLMSGCAQMDFTTPIPRGDDQTFANYFNDLEGEKLTDQTPPRPPIVHYQNVSLTNVNLDNQGSQIIVKPGKSVQGTLNYVYNCRTCSHNLGNQIIIGLANRSAQACIYNGGTEGQGYASFELKVPVKPGKYEIRFRALQATDCSEALKAGWGDDDSPSSQTTIGRIIASKRAEG